MHRKGSNVLHQPCPNTAPGTGHVQREEGPSPRQAGKESYTLTHCQPPGSPVPGQEKQPGLLSDAFMLCFLRTEAFGGKPHGLSSKEVAAQLGGMLGDVPDLEICSQQPAWGAAMALPHGALMGFPHWSVFGSHS